MLGTGELQVELCADLFTCRLGPFESGNVIDLAYIHSNAEKFTALADFLLEQQFTETTNFHHTGLAKTDQS